MGALIFHQNKCQLLNFSQYGLQLKFEPQAQPQVLRFAVCVLLRFRTEKFNLVEFSTKHFNVENKMKASSFGLNFVYAKFRK